MPIVNILNSTYKINESTGKSIGLTRRLRSLNTSKIEWQVSDRESFISTLGLDLKYSEMPLFEDFLACYISQEYKFKLKDFIDIPVHNFNLVSYLEYRKHCKLGKGNLGLEAFSLKYNSVELAKTKLKEWYNSRLNYYNPQEVSKYLNISLEEAEVVVKDYKSRTTMNLDNYIRIYGKELGKSKYLAKCEKDGYRNTLEGKIDLYGQDLGEEMYTKECRNRSKALSLEGYIEKYGEVEGILKFKKYSAKKDSASWKWALNKCAGDTEKATALFNANLDKRLVKVGKASKSSLKLFTPYIEYLKQLNIADGDIAIGVDPKQEFGIYDPEYRRKYLYDLTIYSKKLIVEFDGKKYHPPRTAKLEEIKDYPLLRNLDPVTVWEKDKRKQQLAESEGYRVVVVNEDTSLTDLISLTCDYL